MLPMFLLQTLRAKYIIKQMTGVKSREELERVWAEHPELHNNKEFRNITIDMQKTYPPRN